MTVSGFVAGTLVHTDKGLVPIEKIKVGDMVLSKHESGEGEHVFEQDDSKITLVSSDGDDPIAIYDFNSGQPVCIGGLIYENLHPSEAKSSQDMELDSKIMQLYETGVSHPYLDYVYNLEVEDFHTYYVGKAGIWTHDLTTPTDNLRPHQD